MITKAISKDEHEFAYKVRCVLDEGLERTPRSIAERLAAARKMAIAHKKPELVPFAVSAPQLAGMLSSGSQLRNWGWRVGIVIPLFMLIVGAFGIYYVEKERSIAQLADLDVAVLADELPIDAYLDHGFDAYLNNHGE